MVKWCENLLLLDLVNVDGYGWRVGTREERAEEIYQAAVNVFHV